MVSYYDGGRTSCIIEHMFYVGSRPITSNANLIPGLAYCGDWLSLDEQAALLAHLDTQPWERRDGRRTQEHLLGLRATSAHLAELGKRVAAAGLLARNPARVEVIEYRLGDGDPEPAPDGGRAGCWATLSLGSPCVMICEHTGRRLTVPLLLGPGSLFAPRPDACSAWRLTIPRRKIDQFEGRRFARGRRLALRFGANPTRR